MNTTGRIFRCTTFGESHGRAIGAVVDGCPAGIEFSVDDLMPLMERRRPGKSPISTARSSGIFEGKTTGTPVAMVIRNENFRSGDYDELKDVFRPGHADYTYLEKYGIRDFRGGGRSSGRETAGRVMAGALAMKLLAREGISVSGKILGIHGENNPDLFENEILSAKKSGDSVGGIVEISVKGCPAGLGDPVFGKLDASLAGAMMSIGAVKGVEIGDGFLSAGAFGSENNDCMDRSGFLSNHCGGILGGISNGNEIVVRIAVKPTPSIEKEQKTIDTSGSERVISVGGRHDPCIVPRVVVVAESMAALTVADALLAQKVQHFLR